MIAHVTDVWKTTKSDSALAVSLKMDFIQDIQFHLDNEASNAFFLAQVLIQKTQAME